MRIRIFAAILSITVFSDGADSQSPRGVDLDAIDRTWAVKRWSAPHDEQFTTTKPAAFAPPAEDTIPDNAFGQDVRRGLEIFIDTRTQAKGYVGNGLRCASCHLDRGRRAGSAPMWAAWVRYPEFRSKDDEVNTFAMRLQGCFRFSMNGTPPPQDSAIITALMSYAYWLAQSAPTGAKLKGAGFPSIAEPATAPSIERGSAVFAGKCAACHGADGQGTKAKGVAGYQFPPLWGPQSYNWGAGMTSVDTAASFIKANMPWGLSNALTDQEAWDVAMFVNSHPRPQDPRFSGSVAETRKKFHDSKWSLYGTVQNGILLGAPTSR